MSTLSPERWRQISPHLDHALSLDEAERTAWLKSFDAENPELADLIRKLLEEHMVLDGKKFLETPPETPASESSLSGRRIGPYTLLSPIAQGGMGSVWLAERSDGRFERKVAVKFLQLSVAHGGVERFKREGKILAQFAHPHIAELLDAGVSASGEPYLVLEYVDGEPITEYCDRKHLDVGTRVKLFLDVLDAIANAHASLIVHRDIKPSNVLVRNDGQVKLLDFGIAKLLDDETGAAERTLLTVEGGGALTPQYAAPEQVTGTPITTATDVYSLGVLLYLLLTGQHPTAADNMSPAELINAVTDTEPRRASTVTGSATAMAAAEKRGTTTEKLSRQLRGDLDTIVAKALKKVPADRYSSVTSFAEDLQRYLKHEPISARRDSFLYRTHKFVQRNKLGVAIVAFVIAGTAVALIAINREAHRAEYRFQQVRKLAHSVLFDLNPQIELLAGSTKAREELVKTSLAYLDSLAKEGTQDPALKRELAEAYIKIGDVQGNPNYANLGHPAAALESYTKAITIAKTLGSSAEALELLATAYSDTGTIQASQSGMHSVGRENLEVAASIADSIPRLTGKPAYRLRLLSYGFLGDVDKAFAPDRAAEPLHRCLDIAREWTQADPGREPRFLLAVATREWSDVLWNRGDLHTARDTLLQSIAMFHEVLTEDPNNGDWIREQHVAEEEMGLLSGDPEYFNLGDTKSAAEWLQKDADGHERLLVTDPSDVRARFGLSEALAELGAVFRESDPHRAEKLYLRSLSLSTEALQSNPQDTEMLYWQSFERVGFAMDLALLRQHSQALEQLQRAIQVLEDLGRRDSSELFYRDQLGRALSQRAMLEIRVGNPAGAAQDLQRAKQILDDLLQQSPRNLQVLQHVAECYREMGSLATYRHNWPEATTNYQKSIELWDRWPKIGTSTTYDQGQRGIVARLLGQVQARLGGTSEVH